MKKILMTLLCLGSLGAQAQTLDVACNVSGPTKTLSLRLEPNPDRNGALSISQLVVNKVNESELYDVSPSPNYKDGEWNIQAQFGVILGSSLELKLQGCNSQQSEGTGKGNVVIYYGRPSPPAELNCVCRLQ
jgi:hypothetical protein